MNYQLSASRERMLLLTLAGIQFTNIVDFMIMMPLGPQIKALFGIDNAQFGLVVSAYNFAAGISSLLALFYIDRLDRKKQLIVLYVLFALATLFCGLAQSYQQLLSARVFTGFFGGVLTALAQTIIGDVVPFERRGRAMAIVMTAFSVATVAGVPLGLWLAAHFSWHMPFFALTGLCLILVAVSYFSVPNLADHIKLKQHSAKQLWQPIIQVATQKNYLLAYVFTALLICTGFSVIPYISLYLQGNLHIPLSQIPIMYIFGGIATIFSARLIGKWTDKYGKHVMYRCLAALVTIPVILLTCMPSTAIWGGILVVTSLFFVLMSGRMVPSMSILTALPPTHMRGAFMTVNNAVQSITMGFAAYIGGILIGQNAQGNIAHYWWAGLFSVCCSLLSIWVVGLLHTKPNSNV